MDCFPLGDYLSTYNLYNFVCSNLINGKGIFRYERRPRQSGAARVKVSFTKYCSKITTIVVQYFKCKEL